MIIMVESLDITIKKKQERIINNFRSFTNNPYLHQPSQVPPFAAMHQPQPSSQHPYYHTQGSNGSMEDHTIDLTSCNPSTKVEMIPNFLSMLNSLDDDNEERERKKSKLIQVCVNHTRSTLKKNCKNVQLTNDSSSGSSTASNHEHDSDSDYWKKMPADVSKKSSNENKSAGSSSKKKHEECTNDSSGSESLL